MLLTHSECELILERYGAKNRMTELKLKDFEIKPATQVIGYLGDYYQLTIFFFYSEKQVQQESLQLFVKTVPQASDEPAKEMIFRKESYLYEHLLGDLQNYSSYKWSPTCYYTRSDLLVLEDLSCLGYSTIMGNFDDLHMNELLRAMSCMHAASFIYEHKKGTQISTQFIEIFQEISVSPKISWFTTGLRAILGIIALHPNYQTEWHKQFIQSSQLENILTKVYDMTNTSKKYKNVLCHRDLWAANIFFNQNVIKNGNDSIKSSILVDYQTCRYAPPSIDVVFAIYLNLGKSQRYSDEFKYLDLYYKFLSQDLADFNLNITDYLTKQQLLDSYNDFRLIGALYRAVVMTVIKVPKEVVTNDYKYVDRNPVILSLMKNCDNFRNCMFECAEDVMELALKFYK